MIGVLRQKMVAMLIKVPFTSPVGVDLFSYVTNTFFCSNEFVWLLSFFLFLFTVESGVTSTD